MRLGVIGGIFGVNGQHTPEEETADGVVLVCRVGVAGGGSCRDGAGLIRESVRIVLLELIETEAA